ncbi:MAG: hypothetical protein JWP01_646 [Myxococcales bacterium]|nr:hypothetical protein [Myxococcales bacterium]
MITRKTFLGSLAGLVGIAALGACSSEGSDPDVGVPDGGTPPNADAAIQRDAAAPLDAPAAACAGTGSVSSNHGHVLAVPTADVMAGTEKSYNIRGTSAHPHVVVITASMFATLRTARTLTVTSSLDAGHSHGVTVTC